MVTLRSAPDQPLKLVRLLERLSADERAELLKRRDASTAYQRLYDADLAALLSRPDSLGRVFWDLDAFQHLLLRWLIARQRLHAPWNELLSAIGGRVSEARVQEAVNDLRLWGLVDYDVSPDHGFVATFAAVSSNYPGRGVSLVDYLRGLNSEQVRQICVGMGLKAPTDKEGRIQLLAHSLTPAIWRSFVENLGEPSRSLFEWVRVQGGRVSIDQLSRQAEQMGLKQSDVAYHLSWTYNGYRSGPDGPLAQLTRLCLLAPVADSSSGWYRTFLTIPDEVELALSERSIFDSGPLELPRLQSAEPVATCVPSPAQLVRDIGHLLGFLGAGRCEWRQDGQPYQRSLQALGKLLGNPDPGYPVLLWELCQAVELVAPAGRGKSGFVPADLNGTEPWQLFDGLLDGWSNPRLANPSEWQAHQRLGPARERFLGALQIIPADTWVTWESMQRVLAFLRPMQFAPEHRPKGAADPIWPSAYYLVMGKGVTATGQTAIMLPGAIQAFLADQAANASLLPPWEDSWVVQSDRTVVAPPNAHPLALQELWQVAQLEQNQGAAVFRVSRETIAAALNRGLDPKAVARLLERRSKTAVPATVERLVRDQAERYGQVKVGEALAYIRTDDPTLLDEMLQNRKLGGLRWRRLAPDVACIENLDAGAALEHLRRSGYLPVLEGNNSKGKSR